MKVTDFKLTATQKKVVEAFENAVYYYKSAEIKDVMTYMYIDGERVLYDAEGNDKNIAYITGDNEYAYELSTNTVKSLAKKGLVDLDNSIVEGDGLDKLKINIEFEKPKMYTEFTKVEGYYYRQSKYTDKIQQRRCELIAPSEQIDELILERWENTVETKRTDFKATVCTFRSRY